MASESSPLLSSSGQANQNDARAARNRRWRRIALQALIPLAVIAVVVISWQALLSSNDSSADESVPATSAPEVMPSMESNKTEEDSGKDEEEARLMTLLPPFTTKHHALPPKLINRSDFNTAIPTNAFWTDLLVGDDHGLNAGAGEITLSPYTIRSLPKRLEVSYGDSRRVVRSTSIIEYFNVDMAFTGYAHKPVENETSPELLGDGNSTSRRVVAFDPLSVTVQYFFNGEDQGAATQWMKAPLMRGSPYMTVEYEDLVPVVEMNASLVTVNHIPINTQDGKLVEPVTFTSSRFELDVEVYGADQGTALQKWILYFEEPRTLQLQLANELDYRKYNLKGELTIPTNFRLVDTEVYTGAARLAIVPTMDGMVEAAASRALDTFVNAVPYASHVNSKVENGVGTIEFCWDTKRFGGNGTQSQSLLMMAQPHHAATLRRYQPDPSFQILTGFGFRTLKSRMTPIVGTCWTLEEELPDVGFRMTEPVVELEFLSVIKMALAQDADFEPYSKDPYFFGKEIGRQARLVMIADTLGELNIRERLLDKLQMWIQPWLLGQNDNPFVYDETWGGICSQNGLKGIFYMTDFGNGWYNDHHFHYGYLMFSVAIVAKFRPHFALTHKAAILSIVRDVASMDGDDSYFPFTRHFSWFDGHSFASGVYTLNGGKSQESVSEAINAYYGVYLLGKAMELSEVEHTGHLLMAMEMRGAKTYWQMPSTSDIYEPLYAQNKMTGQVASTQVLYTTWFGPQAEHIHLINVIPFTPATEVFITPEYVMEEYPVLADQALHREEAVDSIWKGYMTLDLAIIKPEEAWIELANLESFDDGSSRTNSLYWIATRRTLMHAKKTKQV